MRGKLSIVCPAYQEEEVLPLFHAALCDALRPLSDYELEIIYVDDGSRDRTLEVLRGVARADSRVRYLSLSRNFGHQAALTAGLEHADGDAIVSLDSDLQHPPSLIPELVGHWRAGSDVVLTIRAEDARLGWFKRTSSRLFYRLLARCSKLEVRPAASDFRLLSRSARDALSQLRESHRYLRGMVQWIGFRTTEVPFQPDPRKAGVSKYTLRKMVRFALDGLLSFSPMPMRAAIGAALAATACSWVFAMVATFVVAPASDPVTRAAALGLTALHGLAGGLFAGAGVLGEYMVRIYDQSKDRPGYVVKEASRPAVSHQVPRAA